MICYVFHGEVKQISLLKDGKAQAMLSFKAKAGSVFDENVIVEVPVEDARLLAPGTRLSVTFDVEADHDRDQGRVPPSLPETQTS